jgi:hypothetical protein
MKKGLRATTESFDSNLTLTQACTTLSLSESSRQDPEGGVYSEKDEDQDI